MNDTTERLNERAIASERRSEGVYDRSIRSNMYLSRADCSTLLFNSLNRILRKDEELKQVFHNIMFN